MLLLLMLANPEATANANIGNTNACAGNINANVARANTNVTNPEVNTNVNANAGNTNANADNTNANAGNTNANAGNTNATAGNINDIAKANAAHANAAAISLFRLVATPLAQSYCNSNFMHVLIATASPIYISMAIFSSFNNEDDTTESSSGRSIDQVVSSSGPIIYRVSSFIIRS